MSIFCSRGTPPTNPESINTKHSPFLTWGGQSRLAGCGGSRALPPGPPIVATAGGAGPPSRFPHQVCPRLYRPIERLRQSPLKGGWAPLVCSGGGSRRGAPPTSGTPCAPPCGKEVACKTVVYKPVTYKTVACNAVTYKAVACRAVIYKTVTCKTVAYKTVACKTVMCKTIASKAVICKTVTCKEVAGLELGV